MTQADMTKLAIALGICYAAYKFVPNAAAKAAALGVAGVIIAKRIPILNAQL
jgi:hypothetical protein